MHKHQTAKSSFKKLKYLIFVISTCSFLLPSNKTLASFFRPGIATSVRYLSLNYDECKSKATQAAGFVFIENTQGESPDATVFRISGRTVSSRAILVCMKKNRGAHFAVVVSSKSSAREETLTLRDRIRDFMGN